MTMDVYLITCSANGKQYVGSTVKGWENRWERHRKALKSGSHHSPIMQRAAELYGANTFSCQLLEEVDGDVMHLVEREQYWMDTLETMQPKGFNCREAGNKGSMSAESKRKLSKSLYKHYEENNKTPEQIEKWRESIKKYHAENEVSEETRRKLSAANRGKKVTEETRRKISEAQKGRTMSEEMKAKVSEGLKQYYAENSMSDDTRQKISDALSGRQRPEEVCRKISEAHQGKVMSEETKARVSDGLKRHYAENDVSEETRQKISETLTGIKRAPFSDEHRQKLSAAKKGRKMSEEQKRKIAEGVRKARARKRAENAAKASSEEPALEGKK